MEIIDTKIPDLRIIKPKVFEDTRGYFFESYNENKFLEKELNIKFVQDNESQSQFGVIRGLHYQLKPYSQTKLVRVIKGSVLDVAVDIRKGSPTFGWWESIELTEKNKLQLLIPKGFAHGFVVLSEIAIFSYKCDEFYKPDYEKGIIYNDSKLNIDWKIDASKIIISERDKKLPKFENAELNFTFNK